MLAYGIKYTCSFTNVFTRHLSDSMGLTLRDILAPFRKWNSVNNFRKYVKFGTDWVDSMLNTLQAYNIFHNGFIHKSLNNIWTSLGIVMFSCGSTLFITETHLRILRSGVY